MKKASLSEVRWLIHGHPENGLGFLKPNAVVFLLHLSRSDHPGYGKNKYSLGKMTEAKHGEVRITL